MAKKLGAAGMNLLVIDTGALCWVHLCSLCMPASWELRGLGAVALWPGPFVAGSE
jgi:hypothetical protein